MIVANRRLDYLAQGIGLVQSLVENAMNLIVVARIPQKTVVILCVNARLEVDVNLNEIRQSYREQGYCIVRDALTQGELAGLCGAADELLTEKPKDGGEGLHNIGRGEDRRFLRHRHEEFPAVSDFLFSRKMQEITSAVVGPTPFLFNEQFVVKGSKTGSSFAWHQDGAYVGFDHKPYVTVWIALDDVSEENGCVSVLPRNLDADENLVPHEWDEDGKELVGYAGKNDGNQIIGPAGTMAMFSSTTLHRSGANTTDRRRRAYICQFTPEPLIDPSTNQPKRFAKPLVAA